MQWTFGGLYNPKLIHNDERLKPNGTAALNVDRWKYDSAIATLIADKQNNFTLTVSHDFTYAYSTKDQSDRMVQDQYTGWMKKEEMASPHVFYSGIRYDNGIAASDSNNIILTTDINDSDHNARINYTSNPTIEYGIPPHNQVAFSGFQYNTVSQIGPWKFTLPLNRVIPTLYMFRHTTNNRERYEGDTLRNTNYFKRPTMFRTTENGPERMAFALDISAPAPPLDVKVYKYIFYDRQLLVNFNPPDYEGASAVIGYYVTATAVDGSHTIETYETNGVFVTDHDGIRESRQSTVGLTGRGRLETWKSYPGRCSITMGGFRQGVSYRITVASKNGYYKDANDTDGRRSRPSNPSDPVTPITPPRPPFINVISDGNSGVNVIVKNFGGQYIDTSGITATGDYVKSFRVYSKLNGVDGPSYTYNLDQKIGGWEQSTANLTGFTPGQTYSFYATVTNSLSLTSVPSAKYDFNPTIPSPPRNVRVTINGSTATVTCDPPASSGASAATGYIVRYPPTGWDRLEPYTVSNTTSPIIKGNLDPLIQYRFSVVATNGGDSQPSPTIIVPGPPQSVRARYTSYFGTASVSFSTPIRTGSETITGYNVYSAGTLVGSGTTSPVAISGLTGGQSYTFTVAAVSQNCVGFPSVPSNNILVPSLDMTPKFRLTPGDKCMNINIEPRVVDSMLDGYNIYLYLADQSPGTPIFSPASTLTYKWDGLTNGTAYRVVITTVYAGAEVPGVGEFKTAAPCAPLGAMTLAAVAISSSVVSLSWSFANAIDASTITSYTVDHGIFTPTGSTTGTVTLPDTSSFSITLTAANPISRTTATRTDTVTYTATTANIPIPVGAKSCTAYVTGFYGTFFNPTASHTKGTYGMVAGVFPVSSSDSISCTINSGSDSRWRGKTEGGGAGGEGGGYSTFIVNNKNILIGGGGGGGWDSGGGGYVSTSGYISTGDIIIPGSNGGGSSYIDGNYIVTVPALLESAKKEGTITLVFSSKRIYNKIIATSDATITVPEGANSCTAYVYGANNGLAAGVFTVTPTDSLSYAFAGSSTLKLNGSNILVGDVDRFTLTGQAVPVSSMTDNVIGKSSYDPYVICAIPASLPFIAAGTITVLFSSDLIVGATVTYTSNVTNVPIPPGAKSVTAYVYGAGGSVGPMRGGIGGYAFGACAITATSRLSLTVGTVDPANFTGGGASLVNLDGKNILIAGGGGAGGAGYYQQIGGAGGFFPVYNNNVVAGGKSPAVTAADILRDPIAYCNGGDSQPGSNGGTFYSRWSEGKGGASYIDTSIVVTQASPDTSITLIGESTNGQIKLAFSYIPLPTLNLQVTAVPSSALDCATITCTLQSPAIYPKFQPQTNYLLSMR